MISASRSICSGPQLRYSARAILDQQVRSQFQNIVFARAQPVRMSLQNHAVTATEYCHTEIGFGIDSGYRRARFITVHLERSFARPARVTSVRPNGATWSSELAITSSCQDAYHALYEWRVIRPEPPTAGWSR
jgi:hypothetical protein